MAAALLLLSLGAAACQGRAVDAALERSTAPLLVPQGTWTEDFRFTAPPGSTDLYQFRWNFRPGRTDLVTGWQVSATSGYEPAAIAEGPGQDVVDQALRASRGDGCEIADPELDIQICSYPSEFSRGGVTSYLVRLEQDHLLVVDYLNIDGDPMDYNAESLEARYLSADFVTVPIDGDEIDDYLVVIY